MILDLGIPPGLDVATEDLDAAVRAGKIARFELTGRQIIVYVAKLVPGQRLTFDVGFTARFPLRAQAPSSRAYLYHDPDVRASSRPVDLTVGRRLSSRLDSEETQRTLDELHACSRRLLAVIGRVRESIRR